VNEVGVCCGAASCEQEAETNKATARLAVNTSIN
jgi:hypothetical protein